MALKAGFHKAIQLLPGSLGTLTLGAQPPGCEETQVTWEGRV